METKSYSTTYRIIHWAIAISFMLLLLTIFLRLTWMNKEHVAQIIQEFLKTTDQTLSQDQLIVLAKQIRKPMWNWHIYLGYILVALFSVRLIVPLFGEMKFKNPLKKGLTRKEQFQFWTYLIFFLGVFISLATGLLIEFGPREFKNPIEAIHKLSIYYLVPYIIIHLGGVLLAEFSDRPGIISSIVGGAKGNKKN